MDILCNIFLRLAKNNLTFAFDGKPITKRAPKQKRQL
ncbi:hypothetical protein NEOC95_002181 [Neochlamydia sp. AcF95]|nr:hypothetical protein [Neochlamydia sp. AcF95]